MTTINHASTFLSHGSSPTAEVDPEMLTLAEDPAAWHWGIWKVLKSICWRDSFGISSASAWLQHGFHMFPWLLGNALPKIPSSGWGSLVLVEKMIPFWTSVHHHAASSKSWLMAWQLQLGTLFFCCPGNALPLPQMFFGCSQYQSIQQSNLSAVSLGVTSLPGGYCSDCFLQLTNVP